MALECGPVPPHPRYLSASSGGGGAESKLSILAALAWLHLQRHTFSTSMAVRLNMGSSSSTERVAVTSNLALAAPKRPIPQPSAAGGHRGNRTCDAAVLLPLIATFARCLRRQRTAAGDATQRHWRPRGQQPHHTMPALADGKTFSRSRTSSA